MPSKVKIASSPFSQWVGAACNRLDLGSARLLLFPVFLFFGPGFGEAARFDISTSGMCDRAAVRASQEKGVPLDVLLAISRAETGRSVRAALHPWPWTVNMEGTGRWFETLDEAQSYVFLHFKEGARSFDVGCFQINYKWHGSAFRTIDDMFDPVLNALYAAEFLKELFQEFGNWPDAAGAYHSRTSEIAREYTARFDRIRASLSNDAEMEPDIHTSTRQGQGTGSRDLNTALGPKPLVSGGSVTLGSLFPIVRHADNAQHPFIIK